MKCVCLFLVLCQLWTLQAFMVNKWSVVRQKSVFNLKHSIVHYMKDNLVASNPLNMDVERKVKRSSNRYLSPVNSVKPRSSYIEGDKDLKQIIDDINSLEFDDDKEDDNSSNEYNLEDNDKINLINENKNNNILTKQEERFTDDQGSRLIDKFFFSKKTFSQLGASEQSLKAIETLNIETPSKIQTMAFPHVLEGKSCIIAEQTGSGKTLAYLLPILQRLKEREMNAAPQDSTSKKMLAKPNKPKMLVVVPTMELAQQVTNVARKLTRIYKLRVACMTGGKENSQSSTRTQTKMLKEGVEIVVTTPGRLNYLMSEETNALDPSDLEAIILDEVDVLFLDETFDLKSLGDNRIPSSTQFLFVSATIPTAVAQQINTEFPKLKKLYGPGLHKVAPQIEENLIDCSSTADDKDEVKNEDTAFERKKEILLQVLDRNIYKIEHTLIFCNTIASCRKVENTLNRLDRKGNKWNVFTYHSALTEKDRERNLKYFVQSKHENTMENNIRKEKQSPLSSAEFIRFDSKSKGGKLSKLNKSASDNKSKILVCSDRTSRGVDFENVDVGHVILFDFPRDPSEYLRRVGRTGRAGRKGKVTALVLGRQVGLARNIMQGNKSGGTVHPVPE